MSHYSNRSRTRLNTAHGDLQKLFLQVDSHGYANTILEVARTEEQQRENVRKGVSKTMDSRHLDDPSNAVDAAPDPLGWPQLDDRADELLAAIAPLSVAARADAVRKFLSAYAKEVGRWYMFSGFVQGVAKEMKRNGEIDCDIRAGADWDGDFRINDQRFDDLPHFERKI